LPQNNGYLGFMGVDLGEAVNIFYGFYGIWYRHFFFPKPRKYGGYFTTTALLLDVKDILLPSIASGKKSYNKKRHQNK
jgi:hypothetical protein